MADEPILVERVDEAEDLWQPQVGAETIDFLDSVVPEESRDSLRASSVSILGKGVSPQQRAGQETGLVVGYVQSGKTMSFELVAALARDNGVQMVIVVAGTSNNLLNQSTRRFVRDLRIDERSGSDGGYNCKILVETKPQLFRSGISLRTGAIRRHRKI